MQEPDRGIERGGGAERPARFWGLALLAEDVDGARGVFPGAGRARAAVQPGRRIVTLGRSAGLAVPVALMSARAARGGMSEELWRAVDDYVEGELIGRDPVLEEALRCERARGPAADRA